MSNPSSLFHQLQELSTEAINPATQDIDVLPTPDVVELLLEEDRAVTTAVAAEKPVIAAVVDVVTNTLRDGGALVYVGAGTSGRLGILDASEMPPTYGVPPRMVRGVIAGGRDAVFASVEGAEDSANDGAAAIDAEVATNERVVVCGLSASGRTPFVLGALQRASERGFPTVFVSTNRREVVKEYAPFVDHLICAVVGPEPIAGSTRMKSGTAQKMIVNIITTASMVALGKTYGNVMVDLQLSNEKLVERARRIVITICGLDYTSASELINAAGGHVKTALVMGKTGCSREEAEQRLERANGHVRRAI